MDVLKPQVFTSQLNPNFIVVRVECRMCHTKHILKNISKQGWFDYSMKGELIQKALPDLSAGERELLISGTCNSCFDSIFKDDEKK